MYYTLYAANGTTVLIWMDPQEPEPGTASRFVVADVKLPSLQWACCSTIDSVDCRNNRVHDGVTSLSTPDHSATIGPQCESSQASRSQTASWGNSRT
jgi:hypothetical protein